MAGRPKGSTNKVKKILKPATVRKQCFNCTSEKPISDFYASNNPKHEHKKMNVCKVCSRPKDINNTNEVRVKLAMLGRPLIKSIWNKSIEEAKVPDSSEVQDSTFGLYLKNIQMKGSQYQFADENFIDDSIEDIIYITPTDKSNEDVEIENYSFENKNKEDALRMLGYDPFEHEDKNDRRHLFNKLVDFLDESTLEDNFKLPAVISIVKTFNQIEKIDAAIASITRNSEMIILKSAGLKLLIEAKNNLLKTALALAKDNGISVNHNNNKSKGGGTLSGIIKSLDEKGIEAAEINIFNIETCDAMKQVADVSNRSILEQLMLNENDYTEMINDQRELITSYDAKVIRLEEENRLLKIKLKNYGAL